LFQPVVSTCCLNLLSQPVVSTCCLNLLSQPVVSTCCLNELPQPVVSTCLVDTCTYHQDQGPCHGFFHGTSTWGKCHFAHSQIVINLGAIKLRPHSSTQMVMRAALVTPPTPDLFLTAKAVMANGENINHPGTRSTAPSTSLLADLQNP